jgi:hypothetical protein
LGLRNREKLLVAGVFPVCRPTQYDSLQLSAVAIVDANDALVDQPERILAGSQKDIPDLKRLIRSEMSLLVSSISSHRRREAGREQA